MLNITSPATGLFGALGSLVIAQAGDTLPAAAKGYFEGGAYLGFVGFLSYAVVTLWKSNQALGNKLGAIEKEFRDDWKEQVGKLTAVLERFKTDE